MERISIAVFVSLLTIGTAEASFRLLFCRDVANQEPCLHFETFSRQNYPDSLAPSSSSTAHPSSSSASSGGVIDPNEGDYTPFVAEPLEWLEEEEVTQRCDLTMLEADSACIYPGELSGSRIILPGTTTRFSKNAFKLCAFQGGGRSTVAVYVVDRSGSMQHTDPNSVVLPAIRNAITLQGSIDTNSYAGYIPFHNSVLSSATAPIRLNPAGVTTLNNKIYDGANGGTAFISPLKRAAEWLNQSQFDGFNKLIFFFSDGIPEHDYTPGTSQYCQNHALGKEYCLQLSANFIDEGGFSSGSTWIPFPVIHSMFLGDTIKPKYGTAAQAKQGRGLLDYMAWRTTDSEGREGTYNHLNSADQMNGIMQNLVTTYVITSTPVDFEMVNETTGEEVRVASENIREQPDGTYTVIMDDNLALIPGINQLSLRAKYSEDGEDDPRPMRFEIEVTDRIVNEAGPLTGAPFQTTCYDIPLMRIYNAEKERVLFFQRTDTVAHVRFSNPRSKEGLDPTLLRFNISAESGDKLTVPAPLVGTRGELLIYETSFPIDWLRNKRNDGQLQLFTPDSFRVVWRHTTDQADTIDASQRVLWKITSPTEFALFDSDHDGVLDSMVGTWVTPPDSVDLARLTLRFRWPGSDGKNRLVEVTPPEWFPIGEGRFAARIEPSYRLAVGTALPDSASLSTDIYTDPGRPKWGVQTRFDHTLLIDSMPPIITKAFITASQKEGMDTLTVLLSEPIASSRITAAPYFDFWTFGETQYGRLLDAEVSHPRWKGAIFNALMTKGEPFYLLPGDSVRMVPGIRRIQDQAGNTPWVDNPYIYIDGDRRRQVEVIPITTVLPSDPQYEQNIEVTLFDGHDDVLDDLKRDRRIGMMWGPIKVPRDVDDNTVQVFQWEMAVFTNLGGFVASKRGEIDCTTRELRDRCRSEEGIKVFLEWDKRTTEGRMVGVGAYIMKANLHGRALLSKVGIRR